MRLRVCSPKVSALKTCHAAEHSSVIAGPPVARVQLKIACISVVVSLSNVPSCCSPSTCQGWCQRRGRSRGSGSGWSQQLRTNELKRWLEIGPAPFDLGAARHHQHRRRPTCFDSQSRVQTCTQSTMNVWLGKIDLGNLEGFVSILSTSPYGTPILMIGVLVVLYTGAFKVCPGNVHSTARS